MRQIECGASHNDPSDPAAGSDERSGRSSGCDGYAADTLTIKHECISGVEDVRSSQSLDNGSRRNGVLCPRSCGRWCGDSND